MGRLAVRALAAARKRYGLNGPGVEGLRRTNLAESRSRSFTLIGMSYSFRGSILLRGLKAELPSGILSRHNRFESESQCLPAGRSLRLSEQKTTSYDIARRTCDDQRRRKPPRLVRGHDEETRNLRAFCKTPKLVEFPYEL